MFVLCSPPRSSLIKLAVQRLILWPQGLWAAVGRELRDDMEVGCGFDCNFSTQHE